MFDYHADMKLSMEDIKNVGQKRSIGRKPKKVVKKRARVGSPISPPIVMPMLGGTPMPCPREVPATTVMEVVEVSFLSLPKLAPTSKCPQLGHRACRLHWFNPLQRVLGDRAPLDWLGHHHLEEST